MIGGTGTISYDATKYFLTKGHQVYLLNRGHRNDLKANNLHYIIADALKYDQLKDALDGEFFDVILDFIMFTCEQMKKRLPILADKCKQYIFISSATAYRLVDDIISEDTPLGNTDWKYSKEKMECENFLTSHSSEFNFAYTIVRPYITYDNRRIPFPVITKVSYYSLIERIMKGKPVIICGDGENKLTLTHTRDFAVALEGLLLNPKALNQDFHITSDCVTNWNEILHIIEDTVGVKAEVVYIPVDFLATHFISERDELLYDKSKDHIFDNSKICAAVPQFKTTYSVKDGIAMTVRNLLASKDKQRIDYLWNYKEDAIIELYERENGAVIHKAPVWSKMMYGLYQNNRLKLIQKVFNRFRRIRGGI